MTPPFEITDAPRIVPIEDASRPDPRIAEWRRKAAIWEALQGGEIDANRADRINEALYRQANHDRELSIRLETMSRQFARKTTPYDVELSNALHMVAQHLGLEARRYTDDREAFSEGDGSYIMPRGM
jgi:hypothetical protein